MIFSSKTGVKHRVQMVEEGKRLFMKSTENGGEQVGLCLNKKWICLEHWTRRGNFSLTKMNSESISNTTRYG